MPVSLDKRAGSVQLGTLEVKNRALSVASSTTEFFTLYALLKTPLLFFYSSPQHC